MRLLEKEDFGLKESSPQASGPCRGSNSIRELAGNAILLGSNSDPPNQNGGGEGALASRSHPLR